jgi:hypothetical protein
MTEPSTSEVYSSEDAQQILQRAIARQAEAGELSRQQLLEIADELGISPETLAAAEQEWNLHRQELTTREAFDQERRRRFRQNLAKYGIVNGLLVGLNLATAHRVSWSLYVVFGWGIAVALSAWRTFQTEGDDYDRAFQRWQLKRQVGQSLKTLSARWLKRFSE